MKTEHRKQECSATRRSKDVLTAKQLEFSEVHAMRGIEQTEEVAFSKSRNVTNSTTDEVK
jgi:hypothetical protein